MYLVSVLSNCILKNSKSSHYVAFNNITTVQLVLSYAYKLFRFLETNFELKQSMKNEWKLVIHKYMNELTKFTSNRHFYDLSFYKKDQ